MAEYCRLLTTKWRKIHDDDALDTDPDFVQETFDIEHDDGHLAYSWYLIFLHLVPQILWSAPGEDVFSSFLNFIFDVLDIRTDCIEEHVH